MSQPRANAVGQRIVFLDRDGTLNVDRGYVHRQADWEFTSRAVEAVKLLREGGYYVAVITNQSGIAAGLYSVADVELLHAFMRNQFSKAGADVDAVYYCPHSHEAGCDCHKPGIGMARQVEQQLETNVDYAASWTIGDKLSDLEFGRALGTRTALIRSRYWTNAELGQRPDIIANSLYETVLQLTRSNGS